MTVRTCRRCGTQTEDEICPKCHARMIIGKEAILNRRFPDEVPVVIDLPDSAVVEHGKGSSNASSTASSHASSKSAVTTDVAVTPAADPVMPTSVDLAALVPPEPELPSRDHQEIRDRKIEKQGEQFQARVERNASRQAASLAQREESITDP